MAQLMVSWLAEGLGATAADWLEASLVAESAASMVVMLGEKMVGCLVVL